MTYEAFELQLQQKLLQEIAFKSEMTESGPGSSNGQVKRRQQKRCGGGGRGSRSALHGVAAQVKPQAASVDGPITNEQPASCEMSQF